MSMLNHITGLPKDERPEHVEVLYTFKVPPSAEPSLPEGARVVDVAEILFLPELLEMKEKWAGSMRLSTFITGDLGSVNVQKGVMAEGKKARITEADVKKAIESDDLSGVTGYVCGPPIMTDWLIQLMVESGLEEKNVLCEKWW
jgi:NAD(P)H-flavin reductase